MAEVPTFDIDQKSQEWFSLSLDSDSTKLMNNFADKATNKFPTPLKFGVGKQILPHTYSKNKDVVKNMEIKQGDVWILGMPRSGTTLTQEMVWLLNNNLDFETALKVNLNYRCVFFDACNFHSGDALPELRIELAAENFDYFDFENVINIPSPRHYKSHLNFSLLPDNLVENAKVLYIARNVKDVMVSLYEYSVRAGFLPDSIDFKTYCYNFIEDRVLFGPYFTHLKEGWSNRHHPNVMFLYFEEIVENLPHTLRRVSKFLNKSYTDEQLQALEQHLQIKNMKKNKAVLPAELVKPGYSIDKAESFIRQGKAGTWKEHFDDDLNESTNAWIAKNLAGTDIKFPNDE